MDYYLLLNLNFNFKFQPLDKEKEFSNMEHVMDGQSAFPEKMLLTDPFMSHHDDNSQVVELMGIAMFALPSVGGG